MTCFSEPPLREDMTALAHGWPPGRGAGFPVALLGRWLPVAGRRAGGSLAARSHPRAGAVSGVMGGDCHSNTGETCTDFAPPHRAPRTKRPGRPGRAAALLEGDWRRPGFVAEHLVTLFLWMARRGGAGRGWGR